MKTEKNYLFFIFCSLSLALFFPAKNLKAIDIKKLPQWREINIAIYQKSWEKALEKLEQFGRLLNTIDEKSQVSYWTAEVLRLKSKSYEEKATQSYHESVNYYLEAYKNFRNHSRALSSLFKAAKIQYKELGDPHNAVTHFLTILARDPNFIHAAEATWYIAESYNKFARFNEAIKFYRRLIANYPRSPFVSRAKIRIKWVLRQIEDPDQVLHLRASAPTEVQNNRNLFEMAQIHVSRREYSKAEELYRKIMSNSNDVKEIYNAVDRIGNIYESKKKDYRDAASIYLDFARQYNGEQEAAKALFKAGKIYEVDIREFYHATVGSGQTASTFKQKKQNFIKAITIYKEITDGYNDSSLRKKALFRIANIYKKNLKQNEEAKSYYQMVEDEYPGTQEAEMARNEIDKLEEQ
ncbi:tetratricopeptide repeat protein [Candidatus Riflebacteria bacterium]